MHARFELLIRAGFTGLDLEPLFPHTSRILGLPTVSPCLDGESIAAFVAGTLQSPALDRVEAHLANCAECLRVVADAAYGAMGDVEQAVDVPLTATQPSSSGPMPASGDVLARKYRLEELLGGGGMGQVFAAYHLELGLRVAIKVLRSGDAHAEARFLREAQTCARLKNDHIPRVFDLGRLPSGAPYIVMECLVGEDLAQRSAKGPIEPDEAAAYVLQACIALKEAHAVGVVHRDIKPANLFLATQKDGAPLLKVLDFGISKLTSEVFSETGPPIASAAGITAAGTILGSPRSTRERTFGPWASFCINSSRADRPFVHRRFQRSQLKSSMSGLRGCASFVRTCQRGWKMSFRSVSRKRRLAASPVWRIWHALSRRSPLPSTRC